MVKVIWSEPALEDLREIVSFIERDSPVYAEAVGSRLVTAPRRLEAFPRSGRSVPEYDHKDVRELICGSHRIIYLVRSDACYILAVIHASRDIVRHLKPGDWLCW